MNTSRPTNLICEIKFGSHLYGTATERSDEDYIGVFLPSVEEILLGRIPKTANSSLKDDTRKNEAGELDATYIYVPFTCISKDEDIFND
jgi:predicted nucleotidyltransferase